MLIRFIYYIICLCSPLFLWAQKITPEKVGFQAYQIKEARDTIDFYIYQPDFTQQKDLFVFISGSYPAPLWIETDPCCVTLDPFNYALIPDHYAYLVITKTGFGFSGPEGEIPPPFWAKQSLDFRAERADKVIKYVQEKLFQPRRIVVLGHSQGADVVAKLGTINPDISHIGFWGSGGANQLLDFVHFTRKAAHKGEITEQASVEIIDSLLNQFQQFYDDPNPNKYWDENSYQSYVSFSVPPVENLLKINVPIHMVIGTADENVSVESSYLVPLEFMRKAKKNLTFRQYANYDHGFVEVLPDGKEIDHWDEVTQEFFEWVEKKK